MMSRLMLGVLFLGLSGIIPTFAGYERNVARPVEQVVFGKVESVRGLSQQQIVHARGHGLNTLLGSVVGGVIGAQFGRGQGRVLATAAGAITGAALATPPPHADKIIEYQLVELLIRTEDDQLIDVIQDYDPNMRFTAGHPVRILYFSDGVRVDLTY